MPTMYKTTLNSWYKNAKTRKRNKQPAKQIFQSAKYIYSAMSLPITTIREIGIKAILLLEKLEALKWNTKHEGKCKGLVIKGLIRDAKDHQQKHCAACTAVTAQTPLIGIEPST